jgi:allantoinase
LTAEEIADGALDFKCAPPIRERENREQLWRGLQEGAIDMVVTDHSPCPPEMKRGSFFEAWGGISSLQLSLAVVWTNASRRGFSLLDVSRWMSREPAKLAGLDGRKGAIAKGMDADLVIWNPEAQFRVDAASLMHRHKATPYAGQLLNGVVESTYVRGRKVGEHPAGALIEPIKCISRI